MNELQALRKFFWDYKQCMECGIDEREDKAQLITHSYNLASTYYMTQDVPAQPEDEHRPV